LLQAHELAADAGVSDWVFAVETSELLELGISRNIVRWLVQRGYAAIAIETTPPMGKGGRCFDRVDNLIFSSNACLVLTPAGVSLAADEPVVEEAEVATRSPPLTPHWDPVGRVLSVGEEIVKQFRVPADNQELILAAFQEEGWPSQIDDPLPPEGEIDAKRRLHDTINRLNRNQRRQLIRFKGNGNGCAIRWESVPQSPADCHQTAGRRSRRKHS
jgi:hypothetical protein